MWQSLHAFTMSDIQSSEERMVQAAIESRREKVTELVTRIFAI